MPKNLTAAQEKLVAAVFNNAEESMPMRAELSRLNARIETLTKQNKKLREDARLVNKGRAIISS